LRLDAFGGGDDLEAARKAGDRPPVMPDASFSPMPLMKERSILIGAERAAVDTIDAGLRS
jgi:hypothetical protein